MKLEVFGATNDAGLTRNDDAWVMDSQADFHAVADGFGGNPGGVVASRTAIASLQDAMRRLEQELVAAPPDAEARARRVVEGLQSAMAAASEKLFLMAEEDAGLRGMGTSLLGLKNAGNSVVLGHVGRCRAWLVRRNRSYRLTEDHTMASEFLRLGLLKPGDLPAFPHRGVVTRALGIYPTVIPDLLRIGLNPGDVFFLGSNGFGSVVEDDDLLELAATEDLAAMAGECIALALRRKTRRNVTVVCVRATGEATGYDALAVEQKIAFLKNNFLFRDLNFQELVRILRMVDEVGYRKGQVVFTEGEAGDDFYILVSGKVAVSSQGTHLTDVGPGGHFGELSLVLSPIRSATAMASEPTRLLRVTRADFEALVREEPALANKLLICMLQSVGTRVRDLSRDYTTAAQRSPWNTKG